MKSPHKEAPFETRFLELLQRLYGKGIAGEILGKMHELLEKYLPRILPRSRPNRFSEQDVILITYADQVTTPEETPLKTLASFCREQVQNRVSAVHILPFYPWSSDDGFAVKDFFRVAPEYGSWEDIVALGQDFDLMFDAVFNHMSAQSEWFHRFMADEPGFRNYFVTVEGTPDLSKVVRPRALPLLTQFNTKRGPEMVWTTFSADQVDLNVKNPAVLLALLDALLFYVERGAKYIRLDAIAYLWKETGTSCIHLPETHVVIQLMRAVLDKAAPHVQLITETNVPHRDNTSYFGDGWNEAQMVYNFALPPLVLHAVLRGDASYLNRWAAGLQTPSDKNTFFNFLASHDGIGLNPTRGILPDTEIDYLVDRCQAHGGFINYKHNPDGSKSPYEMNIVYFDAVNDPAGGESLEKQVNRFMTAQGIMLSLAGVPGIYFHSLFGSRNDRQAALESGINRRINRQKLAVGQLKAELNQPAHLRARVFNRFKELLKIRRSQAALSPEADQKVLAIDSRVFALMRSAPGERQKVLCLHNLADAELELQIPLEEACSGLVWRELTGERQEMRTLDGRLTLRLQPYELKWLSGI